MERFYVRKAQKSDLTILKILMYEYIVDFYKRPKPSDEKLSSLVHLLLEERQGIQFVAESNKKLIGFATLYFTYSTTRADKVTIMNDLYVVEPFRGTGVAEQLYVQCKTYSQENNFATMLWETANDNFRAQRFYEKMGGQKGNWITYSI